MDPLDVILGVVSGIIVGYVLQYITYKRGRRIEKIKKLSPYLEGAFPIVNKLNQDLNYVNEIQNLNNQNEIDAILDKIVSGLDQYNIWYLKYQGDGLKLELLSINEQLDGYLNGLFVYAQMTKTYGKAYFHQRLDKFQQQIKSCKLELQKQLMG
jgi:hypothetical protein